MRRRTRTLLLQRKRGLPFPPNPPKVFLCAPPARACVHAHSREEMFASAGMGKGKAQAHGFPSGRSLSGTAVSDRRVRARRPWCRRRSKRRCLQGRS